MVDLFEVSAKLTLNKDEFERGAAEAKDSLASIATGSVVKGTLIADFIKTSAKALFNFGKDAMQTSMSFDQAMGQVAATSGKTSADLVDLRAQALELGRTTKFTATQAAEAMNILAMAGYDANQTMAVMPTTLNLAAAGAMSIAEAADITTGIMAGFSSTGLDMGNSVDQLAMLAASAKGSVSEFGAAINTSGAMAANTKQSFETMAVAAGILGNHNMSASEAGNMLNRTLRNLYMPTTKAQKALKGLGVSVYDTAGNARPLQDVLVDLKGALGNMDEATKNATLSQIFNAATLKSVGFLIEESDTRWNTLTDTLRGAWYTVDGLDEALRGVDKNVGYSDVVDGLAKIGFTADDVSHALKLSGGSADDFVDVLMEMAPAGMQLKDIIAALPVSLSDLQEAYDNTAGAAQRMKEAQEDTLQGDVTKFQSAMEGMKIALAGTLTESSRSLVQFGTDVVSLFTGVFTAGGPIEAIHAFKTRMVEALNSIADDIRTNLPDRIAKALDSVWRFLRGGSKDNPALIEAGVNVLAAISTGIMNAMPSIAANVPLIMRALVDSITGKLDSLTSAAVSIMNALGRGLIQGIPNLLSNVLPVIEQVTANFRQNAGKFVDAGINLILNLGKGLVNSIPSIVKYVPKIISNIAGVINDNAPKLIVAGVKLIGMLAKGLWDNRMVILENMGNILKAVFDVITAINWISLGGKIVTAIVDGVKSMANFGVSSILEFFNNIKTMVADSGGIIEVFKTIGQNIVEGLVNGIKGFLEFALSNIGEFVTSIISFFKSLFGIASPSTVMQEMGQFIVEGLIQGIKDMPERAAKIFTELWDKCVELLQNAWETMSSIVSDKLEWIRNAITTIMTAIASFFSTIWGTIRSIFETVLSIISNVVTNVLNTIRSTVSNIFNAISSFVSTIWNTIKNTISTAIETAKNKVTTAVTMIKSNIEEKLNSAKQTVESIMDKIKQAFHDKIDAARQAVHDAIEKIKSYFNFSWSLPPLKLPHISISGGFSLMPPSAPSFSIDWYKKAYDDIFAFDKPTVIPTVNGFKGFGDGNGREYVMGENKLRELLGGGGYNQVVNIYSPQPLSPWETARQTKNATREMLLNLKGV